MNYMKILNYAFKKYQLNIIKYNYNNGYSSFETDFILYSLNKFNILIVLDFID